MISKLRNFVVHAVLLFILLATPNTIRASSCSLADTNVKYFGYYGLTAPRDIQEAVDMQNTNIIFTSGWGGAAYYPNYKGKFLLELNVGMLGQDGAWYPDWKTTGMDRLKFYVNKYEGRIYAFYFDEPFWANNSPAVFRELTKTLRDTFPDIGILAIEAYPPLLSGTIPSNYYEYVTDLGFDYYFTHYDANNDFGWNQYHNIHNHLKTYLTGKKLWIVPDGHAPVLNPQYWRWKDAFERYICFAKDNNVLGIISFTYKTFPQNLELRDLIHPSGAHFDPSFRSMQLIAGQEALTNLNNSLTISPSKPSDLNVDGRVNIIDFNLLITKFGSPYTIFDFYTIISTFGK